MTSVSGFGALTFVIPVSAPETSAAAPFAYFSSVSIVHTASAAVSGTPSVQRPGRRWKVQTRPLREVVQLRAQSPTSVVPFFPA